MALLYRSILYLPAVRTALKKAWLDSNPGVSGGHEEGGFIVRDAMGGFHVVRWPVGKQNMILVPLHDGCKIGAADIVASFHTHPNTGPDFLQEPSATDKRAVREDLDLKGVDYVGEFVIAHTLVYLVTPSGGVRQVADTQEVLEQE